MKRAGWLGAALLAAVLARGEDAAERAARKPAALGDRALEPGPESPDSAGRAAPQDNDERGVERSLGLMASENAETRGAAEKSLLAMGDRGARGLTFVIGGGSRDMRLAAVRAARLFPGSACLVDPLRVCLVDSDIPVRWAAVESLEKFGALAAPAAGELVAAMLDPKSRVQERAAYAVGKLGAAANAALVAQLATPETFLAARAFRKLVHVQFAATAAGALAEGISKGGTPAIRAQGLRVLRRLRIEDAGAWDAVLRSLLDDEAAEVRAAAAKTLRDAPGALRERAVKALREASKDADAAVRAEIGVTLGELGEGEYAK